MATALDSAQGAWASARKFTRKCSPEYAEYPKNAKYYVVNLGRHDSTQTSELFSVQVATSTNSIIYKWVWELPSTCKYVEERGRSAQLRQGNPLQIQDFDRFPADGIYE